MAKPLKFHQTLNQAPRSMKRGKHWRTSASAHSHPIIGTDFSAGGADQGVTYVSWNTGSTWVSWDAATEPPEPPAIPYAGVRTGEIVAYRAWFVVNANELRSLAHHFIWQPGATISGDVLKPIDDTYNWFRRRPPMGGVYAHLSAQDTRDDVRDEWAATYPVRKERDDGGGLNGIFPRMAVYGPATTETVTVDHFWGVVIGSVKLWGEVIEHETGYRAQYAKLVSLDEATREVDLVALRAKYLGA